MTKDRIKEALIPAFITLAVFACVLLAKGIYPFGALRIDYYDMGQTNAPLYYHIWDFLHGRGGLFYSWYIDEGQNLAMGSSIQWNISVFNLFFLFIKRSAVMKSLSVFMGLHLFFMAFNMNLLLGHTTDTPRFYRILFAVAYGLTGFTLTHYTIPTYLDTAALMPLYLITLYDVLSENKTADNKTSAGAVKLSPVAIYALMTGYMTGLGYYMAFMNLIFVLLVAGTYIFVICGTECIEKNGVNKASRRQAVGRAATRLGIGTFAGLGLSSFILLPAAMQMMKSSRFNSNLSGGLLETLHDILWAIGADMYYIKWWLLSGSVAAIVILLSGLIRFRKERRQAVFFFLFCMYPCALIVFESINLLWHMGTYYHYPVRCGYLIPITLLVTAAYYAGKFENENRTSPAETGNNGEHCVSRVETENNRDHLLQKAENESDSTDYVNHAKSENEERSYVNPKETENDALAKEASQKTHGFRGYAEYDRRGLIAAVIASVAACTGIIYYYTSHDVWQIEQLFRAWVVFALILAVIYVLIWCVLKRPVYIAPVLMAELAVTAFVGYGAPHFVDRYSSDPEQSGDYVVTAQELSDSLGIEESRTDRIKNPDTTLNTNYGFIMRRATVGGWANTVPGPQMDSAIALGYGAHFMRILDCGGTLLSDAALHVTETLTLKPDLYSEKAWNKSGEAGGYILFKNKYTLPFVMKIKSDALMSDNKDSDISRMNVADATNTLYGWLDPDDSACRPDDADSGAERPKGSSSSEDYSETEREQADTSDGDSGIMKDITSGISEGSYYVNRRKALYLREGAFDKLTINGRIIPVPDIGDPEGTSYPAWFNSGVIFLGIYEDEDISVDGAEDPDTRFYELDMDKLEKLCASYSGEEQEIKTGRSSLDITLQGSAGQTALIPLAYDTGFNATVNGIKTEVKDVSDVFMGIPLTDGVNDIHLTFTPDGLIPGTVISLVFLALILFFTVKPVRTDGIDKMSGYILAVLWAVFVTALYLIPYAAFIIHQIEKRLL